LPIEMPPLRERGNDILVLAKHFLKEFCNDNKIELKQISPEAFQKLRSYPFPGNVRELKSLIELAAVMSDGVNIEEKDLNVEIMGGVSSLLAEENTLREYELKIIKHFMEKYDNDVLAVAKKLDVGKSTIYRMIQNGELKQK
ncbi:MAG TPA: sigma-54-dependent Fis family transcriptional regulator, partial [Sediminibacterium sp.]|nr:sigma-54-dependent Fis family transcriptional regulator [Sediminibacterium sp.]